MEYKPRLRVIDGTEFETFLCYDLHHWWPPSGITLFLIAAEQLVGAPFYFPLSMLLPLEELSLRDSWDSAPGKCTFCEYCLETPTGSVCAWTIP